MVVSAAGVWCRETGAQARPADHHLRVLAAQPEHALCHHHTVVRDPLVLNACGRNPPWVALRGMQAAGMQLACSCHAATRQQASWCWQVAASRRGGHLRGLQALHLRLQLPHEAGLLRPPAIPRGQRLPLCRHLRCPPATALDMPRRMAAACAGSAAHTRAPGPSLQSSLTQRSIVALKYCSGSPCIRQHSQHDTAQPATGVGATHTVKVSSLAAPTCASHTRHLHPQSGVWNHVWCCGGVRPTCLAATSAALAACSSSWRVASDLRSRSLAVASSSSQPCSCLSRAPTWLHMPASFCSASLPRTCGSWQQLAAVSSSQQ
jgi:hypothetical protein